MVNFSDVKVGDYLMVDFDGDVKRGLVTQVDHSDKKAQVNNGTQEFWYEANQMNPIGITDDELSNLKFHREEMEGGNIKYSKGAFRMKIPSAGDFSRMELWYREEKRSITEPISLHQLQNHFYEMTKVHLDDHPFD